MFLQIGKWKHNITPKITLQKNLVGITIVMGIILVYYKSSMYIKHVKLESPVFCGTSTQLTHMFKLFSIYSLQ